jgi:long-chain acyl-CoA synthetase
VFFDIILSPIFRVKVSGIENLRQLNNQQVIFISNHSSYFDTSAIFRAIPWRYRVKMSVAAAKDFLYEGKLKIFGFIGRLVFNAFPFSRTTNIKQSLKDFGEMVSRGHSVLIFPEGMRSRTEKMLPFKGGIGVIAWHMELPIVPIKIKNLHKVIPYGAWFPRTIFQTAEVAIGKPLAFKKTQSFEEITEILQNAVEQL